MHIIKPGGKFIDKKSNTVYIVRNIKQEKVILVSEDGEASMVLNEDSLALSGFEPLYD